MSQVTWRPRRQHLLPGGTCHKTTQDTTKSSMKFLAAYLDKQTKLREALLELVPNAVSQKLPSYQEIASEHPYVEASFQELIRVALTTPSWHRRTTTDVTILGHYVPAGTDIFGAPSVQSIDDMEDLRDQDWPQPTVITGIAAYENPNWPRPPTWSPRHPSSKYRGRLGCPPHPWSAQLEALGPPGTCPWPAMQTSLS